MKLTMTLSPFEDNTWSLASQIGVEYADFHLLDAAIKDPSLLTYKGLKNKQILLSKYGIKLGVFEGDPIDLQSIKLGLADRDVVIDKYIELLKIFSDLGVKDVCYNFMAGINWYRSDTNFKTRGGALASGFSLDEVKNIKIDLKGKTLTRAIVEDNHRYFLDRILPIAEKNDIRLALHPDDPPIDPFLNCPRIASSVDSFNKILDEYNSSSLGITFCQSNFKLMGGDLTRTALDFAKKGKIFFIHFRDVEGTVENFHETFHDNGPTNMAEMMQLYMKYCPNAFIRPDHVPTMIGENNENFGYTIGGRLFAIGYMKGLIQAIENK